MREMATLDSAARGGERSAGTGAESLSTEAVGARTDAGCLDGAGTRAGDPPLADWMERHAAELRRHLASMLGGADEAEDVLQEVWITAYNRPPEDGPGSNVRGWLYRVATNAALDRLATARRRRLALEERGHELRPEPSDEPDGALVGLSEEGRRRIRRLVADLPRKQREAVWLRWIEGKEYPAIAERIGSSEESARANVYQGLKRLRAELFDVWEQEGSG